VARSARLSELRDLIAARTWHIETTDTQLVDMRTRLDRAETLLPLLRGIQSMDELRGRADERLPKDDLPEDARGRLGALRQAVEERERAVTGARREVEALEVQTRMTPADEAILAIEDELRALVAEAAVHHQDVVHINDLEREHDANEAVFVERCNSVLTEAPGADAREALSRLSFNDLQSRLKAWEEQRRLPAQAREEVARAEEALKAAGEDLDVLPTPEGERKLRQREEALRQLQAREDLLAALQSDIKAAKAQASGGAHALKAKIPGGALVQGVGLIVSAAALACTLAFGLSEAWWLLGPVALGLLAAGGITLRNRRTEAPRAPDEMRADTLARECLKQREALELHEYETFVGHLERAQQALALVAQRPELERRLLTCRERIEDAGKHVEECTRECQQAVERVAELLVGLPVRPDRLADPRQDLLTELSELRTAQRELTRLQGEREAVSRRAREREARAAKLAEGMNLKLSGSAMEAVPLWYDSLQRALGLRRRADEAEAALPSLRESLEQADKRMQTAYTELRAYEERLVALDPDGASVDVGLRCLGQARAWRAEADAVERQLHARFPDWSERADEARTAAASGEPLDLDTEARMKLSQQTQHLEQALAQLKTERDGLRQERDRLASRRSLGEIDGALAALQEEGDRVARRRDRLALVASILREGDARWRDRCQPPVLRAASEYLSGITGGAWDRLHAEPHDGGTRMFVTMQHSGRQVAVGAPLSRALRRQIHLALRLAIAEQLDRTEPLPLVLDDVLIDWDASRSGRGVEVLSGIAARRQVVLITGNSELAENLRGQAGALVLAFPGPDRAPEAPDRKAPAARPSAPAEDAPEHEPHAA
jgi:uncharacterized protein YhaN